MYLFSPQCSLNWGFKRPNTEIFQACKFLKIMQAGSQLVYEEEFFHTNVCVVCLVCVTERQVKSKAVTF